MNHTRITRIPNFPQYLLVFIIGALLYSLIEIIWRGYTHWTMTLTGGFCMVLLLLISGLPVSLPIKWVMGALSITVIEFAVGCVVNRWLHWEVWDYSALPFNLLGQVSLPFTGVWFLLSIPGIALCTLLRRTFGG